MVKDRPTAGMSEGGDPAGAAGPAREQDYVVASHEALFAAPEREVCDACGAELPSEDDVDDYALSGRGVYLWTRGAEVRFESVPLCPSCASAIGMTALARLEIEEEEG
jgi:hypothetical protein